MKLRNYLKKHPDTIVLRISKIEQYQSASVTKIFKFTLSQPIAEIVGSMPQGDGQLLVMRNVTELYMAEPEIDKVKAFTVGNYGNMKMKLVNLFLDVSKPRGIFADGNYKITNPSKAWITSITFSQYASKIRSNSISNVTKVLFNKNA